MTSFIRQPLCPICLIDLHVLKTSPSSPTPRTLFLWVALGNIVFTSGTYMSPQPSKLQFFYLSEVTY